MKNIHHVILFLATCLLVVACNKNVTNGGSQVTNLFTDTVSNIKLGEPLLLSFNNGNNTTIVKWQVNPSGSNTISAVGKYASLLFSKAGAYTVLATANATQATYIVNVSDSLYSTVDTGFNLQASQLIKVLPSENVSFTVNNPPTNGSPIWETIGSLSYANTANNPAVFAFNLGSTGTVKVTVGNQTRSRTVWLANPSINNPSLDTFPFIFFDKLAIIPSVQKGTGGNKLLVLTANTSDNYQGNADSVLNFLDSANQQFTVSYGGVVTASVPNAVIKPASCTNTISNMTVGTHPFEVNFGNDTYTGTITLSASGVFTFSWASNSEVSIYPLVVQ